MRAGSGLLLSTHGRTAASASHIDPREPQAQLQQSQQLLHTLAESAQKQKAQLAGEPDVIGAQQKDSAKQLPVEQGLWASQDSLKATEQRGDAGGAVTTSAGNDAGAKAATTTTTTTPLTIGGGTGTVAAWSRPDLVLASPAGIGLHTPAAHLVSAGHTASLTAGQDIEHAAQAQHSTVARGGLVLYTYGKADNQAKPNTRPVTETGIRLHAASGNVNTQSQSAATRLTADKSIDVASSQAMVKITAPQHVLLTAAGAAIDIRGGNITLKGPGQVEFRAAMKELAGGMDATVPGIEMAAATMNMKPQPLQVSLLDADEVMPSAEALEMTDGRSAGKSLGVAGGAATVPDFKPGLAHFHQTNRRD